MGQQSLSKYDQGPVVLKAYGQYSALEEMITPSLLDDIGFCLHYDDHSLCIMVDVSTTAGGGFP